MTANQRTATGVGVILLLAWWFRKPIATVTTSEGYDLTPYGGPLTVPEPVKALAQAIARAEGFYVSGSVPQRAHNPGDLKVPNSAQTLNGITIFQSDAEGWEALYRQLMLIVSGRSAYYSLDDTILSMARTWTTTQQTEWARNVASALNVSVETPLWQVIV